MTTVSQAKPAGTPTWVDLTVPDVDAARKFYQAVFGWEYDIGGPEFGGYTTARLGQRTTAGLTGPHPGAPPMPAAWSLYFATDSLDADVARAGALGAKVLFPPIVVSEFGGMAICADPTGGAFGFWKAGHHVGWQVADEPGAWTWAELYTHNAKQARDFYTGMLGATAEQVPGGLEYYALKHGDKMLGGIMQIDPAWGNMPVQWIPYFAVANVDAAAALVSQHGGQMMGPIDDSPFGRFAAVRDPSGAAFKIVQPPAR
jgi:uncharacterized protein